MFPRFFLLQSSLFLCSSFEGENKNFHSHRAPHRDCNHSHSGGDAAAGVEQGTGQGLCNFLCFESKDHRDSRSHVFQRFRRLDRSDGDAAFRGWGKLGPRGIWYGNLAGLDGKPSYGVKYRANAPNAKGTTYICPSESVPLGDMAAGEFGYTHYTANVGLSGIHYSTNSNQGRMRRIADVKMPSIAVWIGDGVIRDNPGACNIQMLAFRHGAADPRKTGSYSDPVPYYLKGRANILFADGHSAPKSVVDMALPGNPVYGRFTSAKTADCGYDRTTGRTY